VRLSDEVACHDLFLFKPIHSQQALNTKIKVFTELNKEEKKKISRCAMLWLTQVLSHKNIFIVIRKKCEWVSSIAQHCIKFLPTTDCYQYRRHLLFGVKLRTDFFWKLIIKVSFCLLTEIVAVFCVFQK
jgi:hypothetical protein